MATRGNIQKVMEEAIMPISAATPTVLLREGTGLALYAYGITLPNAVAGYAIGCLFIHTDGAAGSAAYFNEGSATSCTFVEIGAM